MQGGNGIQGGALVMDFSSVQGNIWSFEIFGTVAYYLAVVYHSCAVHIVWPNSRIGLLVFLHDCNIVKVKHVVYIKDWNQEII
jgi:hypothetical protein